MSILNVPVTQSSLPDWVRKAANAINQLIFGKQDANDNLTSIAGLTLTGNSGDAIVVNGTEDGFELVAGGGGGGTTTNALTFNNAGSGAASGSTFDGSSAVTVSYNSVGAAASGHDHNSSYLQIANNLSDVANAGTARTSLGLGTADSPQFTAINLGHASDTTLSRVSTGVVAIGGTNILTASSSVTDLADVNTTGAASDDVLTYSGASWAPAAPNRGPWRLISTATPSAVPTVDFTGLSGYNDLMVVARNVTQSVAGQVSLRLSVNNGVSFYATSGDYVAVPATGAEVAQDAVGLHSTAATAARSAIGIIYGANISGTPKVIDRVNRDDAGAALFVASTSPVNAVRCVAAGNLTGTIYLFGR